MGSKAGASDVKQHPFFRGINWALLRHQRPPIIPRVRDPLDTSNFRRLEESVSLELDSDGLDVAAYSGGSGIAEAQTGAKTDGKSSKATQWREDGRDPFLEFDSGGLTNQGLGLISRLMTRVPFCPVSLHRAGNDYNLQSGPGT